MSSHAIALRKTYKYRLYGSKHTKHLHQSINAAGYIWNHALALQRRYFKLRGQFIPLGKLKSHIAKLRRESPRFSWWKSLGSQAVQQVLERLDAAYQRFFEKQGGRPGFKKVKSYRSFTLKQTGYKVLVDPKTPVEKKRGIGLIRIGQHEYKFVKHRPIQGKIKTVTVKRDACNRLWLCFSVEAEMERPKQVTSGQTAGFDFGLKTFLVDSEGHDWMHPQFFKRNLAAIKKLNRQLSRKKPPSHNRQRAKHALARAHLRIADKRRDFHFQLAHDLCDRYDKLIFEDLNIQGMKKWWGRKVSDLGFAQFLQIVDWVAFKRGQQVVKIGRFERTTGVCSACGHGQPMGLRDRIFCCRECGFTLDRDWNAALNIKALGHSCDG